MFPLLAPEPQLGKVCKGERKLGGFTGLPPEAHFKLQPGLNWAILTPGHAGSKNSELLFIRWLG